MTRMALGISAALLIGSGAMAQTPPVGVRDPRAQIFVARSCTACHGIWALGVKAKTDVAPDLTFAYLDVRNRYGMSLEAFLFNPTGVMRLMLANHLHLTAVDRDSIAHILQGVFKEHLAQLKGETPPIAPDPTWPN
jgi:hypothetical protein